MPVVVQALAVVAALLHVVFFYMESIAFPRPEVHRRFGLKTADQAAVARPIMLNQGFYNLFLGIGVLVGLAMCAGDGTTATAGAAVVVFGLACMALAGIVLAVTSPRLRRAAFVQAAAPLLALALLGLLELT
jgi:putative membrane protein